MSEVVGDETYSAGYSDSGAKPALRVVDAHDRGRWDRYVAAAPLSTFCHQFAWRHVMTDVLGHECRYFASVDENDIWKGVLPLVHVRSALGHFLVSLPFLNDGGALGDALSQRQLVNHALAEARRSGASVLELRSRRDAPGPLVAANRRIAVHLHLPSSVDELWKRTFRGKLRAQIRRPLKEGMSFRTGAGEQESFYRVFAHNMRDLGTPVLPRKFFDRVAAEFGDGVLFGTVYTNAGEPVAVACCFHWRNELEVMWASSIRRFNRSAPNMLLYASLMEQAIVRGVSVFNFGRSAPGSPTHRFKQQWGGYDVPLPWPSWTRDPGASVPTTDKGVYRAAVGVWRRLPLVVTNRVGPFIARLLP